MESYEDFNDFITTYRKYVREVTYRTMLKNMGEIDDDIIDANICWAVTDNIIELLAINNPIKLESSNSDYIISFMKEQLLQNKLLIILQDPDTFDHWFALIGQTPLVHLVEHTNYACNYSETMSLDILLNQMENILNGKIPDRFHRRIGKHRFNIMSFDRKPLLSQTVKLYIKK